jgi:hypothetical protein
MPQFHVDDDLARLVEKLADQQPFENLTFNDALKRVLEGFITGKKEAADTGDLDMLVAQSMALYKGQPKKAPSPSAQHWADTVPELKCKKAFMTWKAICDHLKIETAGDSARRKLQSWVKENRPDWPEVPETSAE